jgi:hypothetical protein
MHPKHGYQEADGNREQQDRERPLQGSDRIGALHYELEG